MKGEPKLLGIIDGVPIYYYYGYPDYDQMPMPSLLQWIILLGSIVILFDNKGIVWLIRKARPEWQKGMLNGIGGHVEENENTMTAMTREFNEETGLTILDWKKFCILTDEETYEVHRSEEQ